MKTAATVRSFSGWELKAALRQPFAGHRGAVASLSITFITLLLLIDFCMIILHLLRWYTNLIQSDYYSISKDRGYAELFQYIKEIWIIVLFAWYAVRSRNLSYLLWSGVFGYIFLDDALMVHEILGEVAMRYFAIPNLWGVRGMDLAELVFYALLGGGFLLTLALLWRFGTRAFRQDSLYLVGLLLIFAFFSGAMDVVHMATLGTPIFRFLDAVEDGGEMVVMSLILWYAFFLPVRVLATLPLDSSKS